MRTLLKALTFIILGIIIFSAGAVTAGLRHWFQPIASVTIRNDGSQNIMNLKFTHETGSLRSIIVLAPLAKGQSTNVRFYVAGEGGYNIEATFSDGRVINGGAGYIESGYKVTEVVSDSSIKSEMGLYGQ